MENWKFIIGYGDLYMISDLGTIKSLPKKTRRGERLLKPIYSSGYYSIDLVKNKVVKKHLIHRLVALTFLENHLNKEQVNHIDGNKLNNKVNNLEWNTRSENQLHSIRIGLRTTMGTKNSQAKLSNEIVMRIFFDKRKYNEIRNEFCISISTISDIKRGYSWTHLTNLPNLKKPAMEIKY